MIQDVMTHPDFRGRGFLHHLAGRCLQDIEQSGVIGYTFPNDLSEKSFRRGDWSELCEVPHRSTVLHDHAPLNGNLRIGALDGVFGQWATEVWNAAGLSVGVRRDEGFLNWRYSKPDNKYHKFRIEDGRGLLVLKVYSNGTSRILHILELLLKAEDRDLLPEVLRFCFDFAARHSATTVTAWLPHGTPYAPQLDAAGLTINPVHSRYVFVRAPAAYASRIENSTTWYLAQGDSDVY